jgi:hypothetical protein
MAGCSDLQANIRQKTGIAKENGGTEVIRKMYNDAK